VNGPATSGYDRLHRSIIDGELLPGEHLVEELLSERLGIGRAAVRLALVRLEHDGLVVREPNRGARVRRVSETEAVEILQARAALEGLAARHAATHADDATIAALREMLATMAQLRASGDLLGVSAINASLHRLILQASGHATAMRLCQALSSQIVRFQYRTVLLPGRAEGSANEHERIVEAIAAHDPDAAEAAMRRHLSGVAAALSRQVEALEAERDADERAI
jgi:DNA-binding GntR family transcriptional regulator